MSHPTIVSPENNRDLTAETLVATAMVRSLNFVLSREFLGQVQVEECDQSIFTFGWKDTTPALMPTWFRVSRIGISSENTCKMYLDAIQRILHSLNDEAEILFLVKNSKKKVDLFLGIRFKKKASNRAATKAISSYANGIWKGLELCAANEDGKKSINEFENSNSQKAVNKAYDTIYAMTGIPSANVDDVAQMTIERFLSGAAQEDVALLISAIPLKACEIDDSLYALREIGGEIESLKTMSVNKGESISLSIQDTVTENSSVSEKDIAIIGQRILEFASNKLGFKPAQALNKAVVGAGAFSGAAYAVATSAAAAATTAAGSAAAGPIAAIGAIGLLSGLIPQKSVSHGTSHSEGTTTQASISITKTIINKHAEGAAEKVNGQICRYEDGRACGMWKVGVYIFGDHTEATNAAYQLKAVVTGKSSALEPIRIHDITSLLEEKGNPFITTTSPYIEIRSNNERFQDTVSRYDAELKTILTTKELSNYINFPLKPMPGLIVKETFKDCSLFEPTYEAGIKTIDFGNLIRDGLPTSLSCKVPVDRLSSHALVAGINGSGKTNSILSVLHSLSTSDIPFMVIEPAKTEYVDWALKYNDKLQEDQMNGLRLNESPIRIFMPGRNCYKRKIDKKEMSIDFRTVQSLRINPFEAIDLGEDSLNILSHIDRIKEIFAAAFPMQDILPVVFENLLYYVYRGTGWLTFKGSKPKRYPYMTMVHGCIDAVVDSLGYEEKNTMTIKACLNTRLSSLMNGWKGEMLDNDKENGISWNELFTSPCVINLSAVGDNTDKAFIMSLFMTFLYEYREAEASLSGFEYSNKLRHLVVLEEAHRIMSYNTYPDSPKARSGEMFSNMLSEVRDFGQGLMIVDQVPTRLIPDSIKNTSLKIIHRLVSDDDISALASASGVKEDRTAMISSLAVGEAIITGADNGPNSMNNGEIYLCKVKKLK